MFSFSQKDCWEIQIYPFPFLTLLSKMQWLIARVRSHIIVPTREKMCIIIFQKLKFLIMMLWDQDHFYLRLITILILLNPRRNKNNNILILKMNLIEPLKVTILFPIANQEVQKKKNNHRWWEGISLINLKNLVSKF